MKKGMLVIVAHPDDETIWMGGTLLESDSEKTIISLCRRDDKERAPKFKRVCEALNAKGYMSDLEDEALEDVSSEEIVKRILQFAEGDYNSIFTHGKNGEYGHKRHVDVNKAVIQMVKDKKLKADEVFFFSYTKQGALCKSNLSADKVIKLDDNILEMKRELIRDVYGFGESSFEFKTTEKIKSETFDRLK